MCRYARFSQARTQIYVEMIEDYTDQLLHLHLLKSTSFPYQYLRQDVSHILQSILKASFLAIQCAIWKSCTVYANDVSVRPFLA